MRKLALTVLLFAFVAITSCNKDDNAKVSAAITGKWYMKKTVFTEYVNGVKQPDQTRTDFTTNDFFEFKENGEATNDDNGDLFTYVRSDNKLSLYPKPVDPKDPGPEYEYIIKQISASDLILYEEDISGAFGYTNEVTLKK